MLRRLATLTTALALVGCSDGLYLPTEVPRQQNIDDRTTVPPDFCFDYVVEPEFTLIPSCVDIRQWPVDDALENRGRHGYEGVTVAGGGRGRGRLF